MAGPYELSREQLADLMDGEAAYRVQQVWDGLYRRLRRPAEMTDLPLSLRRRLEADPALAPALREVTRLVADRGKTVKWSFALERDAMIETVLMRYPGRSTVCVSTQAGCAMACGFCATGQAGFTRHLTGGEIVEQGVTARRASEPDRVSNVVFMGMGEPLANYDQTLAAITRLHDEIGFSARHLTVSTVGLVPGIRRLAQEALPVNLAVSLHAARDELRDELVPVNRRWPLAGLLEACRAYLSAKRRRLSFEWAMIEGVNDHHRDAAELAEAALGLGAPAVHVNLIPLNTTPGYPARGSSPERIRAFQSELAARGVNATIRRNRGNDIDAACGQLAGGQAVTLRARR